MQQELVLIDGIAQLRHESEPFGAVKIEFRFVDGVIAGHLLGAVHRNIRPLHQCIHIAGMFGYKRHTDTDLDRNRNLVDHDWYFEAVMELFDDMFYIIGNRQPRQQNTKLVAAEPRDHIRREQRVAQARAHLLQ